MQDDRRSFRAHDDVTIQVTRRGSWIECSSDRHIYINGKVLGTGGRLLLKDGDHLEIGGVECRWAVVGPESAVVPKAVIPGAWVFSTIRANLERTRLFKPDSVIVGSIAPRLRCPDGPHLHVFAGSPEETIAELDDPSDRRGSASYWRVGAANDCAVKIDMSAVSGLHAFIVFDSGRWRVVDQLSRNGVFVNGQRSPSSYVSFGDLIRFGPATCVLHVPATANDESKDRKKLVVGVAFGILAGTLFVVGALVWTTF